MEYLLLVSRIIFGGYFIVNGINHLRHVNGLVGYAQSKGLPYPKASIILSGLIIVLGGLGILLGIYIKLSVLLIVLFLIPVSFTMHAFWKATDPMEKMSEKIQFQKNMALLAATLAYLFIVMPWPLALNW